MKLGKILATGAVALLVFPNVASAQRKYGMAGCGLGSIVMGPKGSQISAGTTNGSSNSQIFGITSGTSNCVPDAKSSASIEQESFMFTNYATLSKEMAQGNGTTVAGLAKVMGCGEEVQSEFFKAAQNNHDKIFSSPGALAALDTLKETISKNETLARNCNVAAVTLNEGAN
jgi:hypothetical protein